MKKGKRKFSFRSTLRQGEKADCRGGKRREGEREREKKLEGRRRRGGSAQLRPRTSLLPPPSFPLPLSTQLVPQSSYAYFSTSALSFSLLAPTSSSFFAPPTNTWNVGIALTSHVAATFSLVSTSTLRKTSPGNSPESSSK